jgi:hypothetical protein
LGLALDPHGNYLVAAKTKLLRVTPAGVVSTLANAPEGATWSALAVDASGAIIIADGRTPIGWRVSADGSVVEWAATYEAFDGQTDRPVAIAVARDGDYRLAVWDYGHGSVENMGHITRIYRLTPEAVAKSEKPLTGARGSVGSGTPVSYGATTASEWSDSVTELNLHGDRSRGFSGGMVLDENGSILISDHQTPALYRITEEGQVTRLSELSGQCHGDLVHLARDPETGKLIAASEFCSTIFRANPDGSGAVAVANSGKIFLPIAVAVERGAASDVSALH